MYTGFHAPTHSEHTLSSLWEKLLERILERILEKLLERIQERTATIIIHMSKHLPSSLLWKSSLCKTWPDANRHHCIAMHWVQYAIAMSLECCKNWTEPYHWKVSLPMPPPASPPSTMSMKYAIIIFKNVSGIRQSDVDDEEDGEND